MSDFPKRSFRQEVAKLLNSDISFAHSKKTKSDQDLEDFVLVVENLDRINEIDFITQDALVLQYTNMYYEIVDTLIKTSYGDIGWVLINYYTRDKYHPTEEEILPFIFQDKSGEEQKVYFNSPEDLYYFYKQVTIVPTKK